MRLLGIIASSVMKKIIDTFTRTTSGSLGTSTSGQSWIATRGTWYANGSAAQSDDASSNNSIASIVIGTPNLTVSSSVSGGTGVVFWLSDANNWYATVSYGTNAPYTCNCSTGCSTCTYVSGQATGPNCSECGINYTCVTGCPQGAFCFNCVTGAYINPAVNSGCKTCTYNLYTTGPSCPNCGTYTFGCSTCNSYSYYMKLLKSVSGTVSDVISDVALSEAAAAIKVTTSSGTITSYAYSNTDMTTQIGTATASPPSPTRGLSVGIIKTVTNAVQGSTADNFSAE